MEVLLGSSTFNPTSQNPPMPASRKCLTSFYIGALCRTISGLGPRFLIAEGVWRLPLLAVQINSLDGHLLDGNPPHALY